MASVPGYQEYKIGGVTVFFPCKPYPSQFSMMDKIIKGLERQQNCLLESPTGSGKSLALLCSALAWQRAEIEKRDREEETKQRLLDDAEEGMNNCVCGCHIHAIKKKMSAEFETKSTYFPDTEEKHSIQEIDCDDEDDDFKEDAKSFRTPFSNQPTLSKKLRKHVSISYEDSAVPGSVSETSKMAAVDTDTVPDTVASSPKECQECDCADIGKLKRRKIPKIYFGTRTHKQVAQIVRELKKTAYHDVNMTILGSREHTCIHPEVSRMSNKNEGCRDLLKGPGCRMKDRAKGISTQDSIRRMGLNTAWDLEDMVTMCKKKKACPYFLTRALKDQSEIVICPYNYLVDPIIRNNMEIILKGQIIILDEAHNIEDSAREAGSQSVKQETIQKAVSELRAMIDGGVDVNESTLVEQVMSGLDQFLNHHGDKLEKKDFDHSYKIWSGFDIVAQMSLVGLGPVQVPAFGKAIQKLCEDKEEVVRNHLGEELKMSSPTMALIEQLLLVLDYLYREDMKFVEDYRVSIVKATSFVFKQATGGAWLNPRQRHGGQRQIPVVTCTLNFWCMNPAVAFSDFQKCRTVVLSSGTLSPMSSFSSELGMTFSVQLEANHVIKDNQVWVGAIGQGPSGTSLQAVYRNIETFKFQDELGQLVLSVCQTVPHGVLCFFPSYNCLDKLSNRWKDVGLWNKLLKHKRIVAEPRGSDKMNFEELMNLFYTAVEGGGDDEKDGALFLAVCRGKVSEGLDFADNFARAVITVGIPYPNFKDIQVDLKKKYNDQHRSARGLLSGSEWYEIQAYRALNQALGRCIRHRRDWGALILVDERFVKNPQKYHKGLSKWVRNKALSYNTFHSAMESLSAFTKQRIEAVENEESELSFIASTPCTPDVAGKNGVTSPRTPLQDCLNVTPASVGLETRVQLDNSHIGTPVALTPDLGFKIGSNRSSLEAADIQVVASAGKALQGKQNKSGKPNTSRKTSQSFLFVNKTATPGQKVVTVNQTQFTDVDSRAASTTKSAVVIPRTGIINAVDQSRLTTSNIVPVTPGNDSKAHTGQGKKLIALLGSSEGMSQPTQEGPLEQLNQQNSTDEWKASSTVHISNNTSPQQNLLPSPGQDNMTLSPVHVDMQPVKTELKFENSLSEDVSNVYVNTKTNGDRLKSELQKTDFGTVQSVRDASKCDKKPTNPFFKFCKTPIGNKSNSGTCGDEAQGRDGSRTDVKEGNTSPLLFEDSANVSHSVSDKDRPKAADENCVISRVSVLKKPLFRQKSTLNSSQTNDDAESVNVKTEDKDDVITKDLKGHNSVDTKEVVSEDMDDFEGLKVRRRSSRPKKRKSDGQFKPGSKRSKGVDFLDNVNDNDSKETSCKQIMCCDCGCILLNNVTSFERRKQLPPFLNLPSGTQNLEVIFLTNQELGAALQPVSSVLDNGVTLNSQYIEDSGVVLQYVHCNKCGGSMQSWPVLGCRILHTTNAQYQKGQMWLYHHQVKVS